MIYNPSLLGCVLISPKGLNDLLRCTFPNGKVVKVVFLKIKNEGFVFKYNNINNIIQQLLRS